VLRAKPTDQDKSLFEGKFKSAHNTTARMAKLMASTFFALLPLADLDSSTAKISEPKKDVQPPKEEEMTRPRMRVHEAERVELAQVCITTFKSTCPLPKTSKFITPSFVR